MIWVWIDTLAVNERVGHSTIPPSIAFRVFELGVTPARSKSLLVDRGYDRPSTN